MYINWVALTGGIDALCVTQCPNCYSWYLGWGNLHSRSWYELNKETICIKICIWMNALTIYSYLGVDCSLSIASFQIEISFFFPLHAIRERYPRRNTNPERNFKNLLSQSKIVLRCFDFGSNFNIATAALFPSTVTLSVVEHNVVSTCLDYFRSPIRVAGRGNNNTRKFLETPPLE